MIHEGMNERASVDLIDVYSKIEKAEVGSVNARGATYAPSHPKMASPLVGHQIRGEGNKEMPS
jgi:hypothetical protein